MTSKAGGHLSHPVGVFLEVLLLHSPCTEAFGAKPVQDWLLEPSHCRHLWVDVEGVPVAVESVPKSLVGSCLLLGTEVRGSLGGLWILCHFDSAFVAEAARAYDEQARSDRRLELTAVFLPDFGVYDHKGTRAFVLEVLELVCYDVLRAWDEGLLDKNILCAMEQGHRIELWKALDLSKVFE